MELTEENADACIALLRKLLDTVTKPWDRTTSPLFYRLQLAAAMSPMLPVLLSELETEPKYEFLRETVDYQNLLVEYKAKLN